jgi:hypothetical protein
MNDQGQLVWEDCRPKQQVTSIHNWTSAFLIFSAIFLEAHPHRTQELLKYASLIRTAAARYQGWGWREYDKQFRMRQQIQPQRSWASIDNELWTLYAATTASSQYVRPKYGRWSSNSGPFRRFSQPTRFSSTQNQQRSFAKVPHILGSPHQVSSDTAGKFALHLTKRAARECNVDTCTNAQHVMDSGMEPQDAIVKNSECKVSDMTKDPSPARKSSCPGPPVCICCKYRSPVIINKMAPYLELYPNRKSAKLLLEGFTFGFELGYS